MYSSWPLPIGSGHRTGYISRPDVAGRFPVVVILPSIDGLTSTEKDLCRRLARWGFGAVALDFYRQNHEEPFQAYAELDDTRAMTDLDEVFSFISSGDVDWAITSRIGLVGLDVGGRFGLIAAATRPWAGSLVAAYTPLTGDEGREHQVADYLGSIPIPVLGLYGMEDELIDQNTVDEAQRRNASGQWLLYENAGHGFLDIEADGYDHASAEDSFARILAFLQQTLPQPEPEHLG